MNAFTGKGLSAKQKDMQAFVRRLLNWRRTQTTVHHGKLMHFVPENGTYAWFRYDADSTVMVVINKNDGETVLDLARFAEVLHTPAAALDVLTGKEVKLGASVKLPGRSVRIFEVRR